MPLIEFATKFLLLRIGGSLDSGLYTRFESCDLLLKCSGLLVETTNFLNILITLCLDVVVGLLQVLHFLWINVFGLVDELVESLFPVVSLLLLLLEIASSQLKLTLKLFNSCLEWFKLGVN